MTLKPANSFGRHSSQTITQPTNAPTIPYHLPATITMVNDWKTQRTRQCSKMACGVVLFLLGLVCFTSPEEGWLTSNQKDVSNAAEQSPVACIDQDQVEEPPQIRYEDALFLHVGKAGGGTVKYRMKHEWNVVIPHSHPRPHPAKIKHSPLVLINIRDPIDRYASAIAFELAIMCDIDGETRIFDIDSSESSLEHPDLYCQSNRPEEAEILFHKYKRDANYLAEMLYDEERGREVRDDLAVVEHAGNTLWQWMNFDWEPERLYPVVLERPLDMNDQVDDFVRWLHNHTSFEDDQAFAQRKRYVGQLDCAKVSDSPVESVQHSSGGHQAMSDKAIANLARFYFDDYILIQRLAKEACKTADCAMGLQSIVDRRKDLLKKVAPLVHTEDLWQ